MNRRLIIKTTLKSAAGIYLTPAIIYCTDVPKIIWCTPKFGTSVIVDENGNVSRILTEGIYNISNYNESFYF